MGLIMNSVIIEDVNDVRMIVEALVSLAEFDEDFSGANGLDFVSDEAQAHGFDSDAAYCATAIVSKFANNWRNSCIVDVVRDFLGSWLQHDTYYREYVFEPNWVGDSVIITLAVVTE